jgi:hypothetical protein
VFRIETGADWALVPGATEHISVTPPQTWEVGFFDAGDFVVFDAGDFTRCTNPRRPRHP